MDGSGTPSESVRQATSAEARGWPVAAALRAGMHLRARCCNPRCARLVVFDASWWVAGNRPDERLHMLERRMRCMACGGREAGFEVWSGPQPVVDPARPGIYQFY